MTSNGADVCRTTVDQQTLHALLQRVAQQDHTAFARLYDLTVTPTYTFAYRIVRETRGAEDVVTEVYCQIWENAASYDMSRGRVLGWILTICRSRALDYLRRRDSAELHPAPEQLRPDLFRVDDSPLDLMLALERDSQVRAALTALNEREQHVVSLAFFEGLSHQEICERTAIPLGSVKTVLRRVLEILRGLLEPSADLPALSAQQQTLERPPPPRV
jgi:RNA polymerase sigma factor (sigma-70 family)